jgi:hypothetical protein
MVAVRTVAFLVIAVPFLALATLSVVGGGSAGSQTVIVFAAYAVGVIAVVALWIRVWSARRRSN